MPTCFPPIVKKIVLIAALTMFSSAEAQTDPLRERDSLDPRPGGSAPPRRPTISFPSHREAAEKGLVDVRRLKPTVIKPSEAKAVDEKYARALGFASSEEAGRATLGAPLPIYVSRLEWLSRFSQENNYESFMKDSGSRIYPLLIDGKPKSSLTVAQDHKSKEWRPVEWGSPILIGLLERMRRNRPQTSLVLLISPQNPLGLRFLGEKKKGDLLLTPIANIPKLKLEAGQQRSASTIFLSLASVANEYKGAQLEGLRTQPPQR